MLKPKNLPHHNIVHPCNSWAVAAGFGSWSAALEAMKAGQVCAGSVHAVQPASKSMLGMQLFFKEIHEEGLHTFAPEEGSIIVVGFKRNFPADLLADQDKQQAAMAARFQTR